MKRPWTHALVAGFAMALLSNPPASAQATPPVAARSQDFDAAVRRAEALPALETLIVAQNGATLVEKGFHGASPGRATNIKSASKSIVSALVGIAIDKGLLEGPDQPIAEILTTDLPADPDPRLARVTIGNLLSMQAGLERTSGANYGGWIASRNWVRDALARPFVEEPGGPMLYSTGSTHLLSAILTKASGRSTLRLAREWPTAGERPTPDRPKPCERSGGPPSAFRPESPTGP